MSSAQSQNGWSHEAFHFTYDHGHGSDFGHSGVHDQGHDHAQYHYRDVNAASASPGTSTSYAKPHSRNGSRPRVTMACKKCRQRKVRCTGENPKCDLCRRMNRPCDYVRVTPAENAVLRERKRRSKQRRSAEQEAARDTFHTHDLFPAFQPYRNSNGVGAAHRNSFGAAGASIPHPEDRSGGSQAPPLPQVLSGSSGVQPHLYDGRYISSGVSAPTGLFDVGAGLAGRRPSLTTSFSAPARPSINVYQPRKQSLLETSYQRGHEQNALGLNVAAATAPMAATSPIESQTWLGPTSTSYASFRPAAPQAQVQTRYMGAFIPSSDSYELPSPTYSSSTYLGNESNSAGSTNGSGSGGGDYFRAADPSSTLGVSSPTYTAIMPALVRAPSSTGSGASAFSPETSPQHDDASLWSSQGSAHAQMPEYVQTQYACKPEPTTPSVDANGKVWDPAFYMSAPNAASSV